MRLYWTPGHEGIKLNEKADKEAKLAAKENQDPVMLHFSLGGLLRLTKEMFKKRGAEPILPFKTNSRKVAEALSSLEKGQAAAIFQLRCGHCPLKKFLHRIGAEDDDKCETCKAVKTLAHFLIYCKTYTKKRQLCWQELREDGIEVNMNSAWKILDSPKVYPHLAQFILETGRFQYSHTYLDE